MPENSDSSAWVAQVYREYGHKVFRTCQRFAAGDRQWALDRTQDVFTRLVENLASVRDRHEPGGWLYRCAVNACVSALRRQRTAWRFLPFLRHGASHVAPSADGVVRAKRTLTAFDEALELLPPDQRAVVALVYLEEKSQAEAAELLALSKGQVCKLHQRALATLRAKDWDLGHA